MLSNTWYLGSWKETYPESSPPPSCLYGIAAKGYKMVY